MREAEVFAFWERAKAPPEAARAAEMIKSGNDKLHVDWLLHRMREYQCSKIEEVKPGTTGAVARGTT